MTEPTSQSPPAAVQDETPPVPPVPPVADATTQRPHRLPRSRAGGLWAAVVVFAVILLLLLIFILQNGQRSDVYYMGAHGHLPMGVALLLSAIFGVLLVALPTTVRIVQLRLMAARHRGRIAAAARKSAEP